MARKAMFAALAALLCLLAMGCGSEDYSLQDQHDKSLSRLHTDRTYIRDEAGRYVFVHGVNVSGTTKLPVTEEPISYTGRPFPLEDADWNFTMLKEAGFWEAVTKMRSIPGKDKLLTSGAVSKTPALRNLLTKKMYQ